MKPSVFRPRAIRFGDGRVRDADKLEIVLIPQIVEGHREPYGFGEVTWPDRLDSFEIEIDGLVDELIRTVAAAETAPFYAWSDAWDEGVGDRFICWYFGAVRWSAINPNEYDPSMRPKLVLHGVTETPIGAWAHVEKVGECFDLPVTI